MSTSAESHSVGKCIPIGRYMEVRSAYGPKYSHDGSKLYFFSNITGIPQVWVLEGDTPWPRQVTFFSDRVMAVSPSPKDERLVINADKGGSENAQLFFTDSDGVELKDLSQDPKHIYTFESWMPDGKRFSYDSNKRDGRAFDVYLYDVETEEHIPVLTSDHTNHAGPFSPSGKQMLVQRYHTNLNHDLFLVDLDNHETTLLTPHEGDAAYRNAQFSKDGKYLYVITDLNSEFSRAARIDIGTKDVEFLTEDHWDAELLSLSPNGEFLAYAMNEDGLSKLVLVRTPEFSQEERSVGSVESLPGAGGHGGSLTVSSLESLPGLPTIPSGVIVDMDFAPDSSEISFTLSSPTLAMEVWSLRLEQKTLRRRTYASVSGVPQETFVEPELIHYPSFDGLSIPAFYFRPQGHPGPHPVVVYVHGGPESQSRNNFNGVVQYFVNRGYAVLVPNVRGSNGYGRDYVHKDDVRKRMDSVADLAKCVDWLVKHGNADKDAIAVMGGSYGGFMVLAAVTHYPDLWAAGVDIVGIANLRTFMENTSAYRRHLRACEYGTVEEDGAFFDEISPIHHVQRITAPMIVIHGANDPRVPIGEAEQIVAALEVRNHPVEYLRFEDEGHGIVKLPNRIKAYGAIADFLDAHLKK